MWLSSLLIGLIRFLIQATPEFRAPLADSGKHIFYANHSSHLDSLAIWAALRFTDLGRAMRAAAEDGPIAAAFGVNQPALALLLSGVCAALAGVAGVCIALSYTLAPAQIYAWIGVVFAAVMMGGLGRALGPLVAGIVIGVSEAITMAVTAPSWAPLVSFSLLIVVLLARPGKVQ